MAKRPAFTPDEAQHYLLRAQQQGRIQSIPRTDRERQRLARGLSQGKTVAQARGHGTSESRPAERKKSVSRAYTYAPGINKNPALAGQVAWEVGPNPSNYTKPWQVRGRVPQPHDLVEMVARRTSHRLIMVGVHGWLNVYMEDTGEPIGWLYPHIPVERDWLLGRLIALSPDHFYAANDPAYLQLAHDIFERSTHSGNSTWDWSYVYQWSVRDL